MAQKHQNSSWHGVRIHPDHDVDIYKYLSASTLTAGADWESADRGNGHPRPEWGITCPAGLTWKQNRNNNCENLKHLPVSHCGENLPSTRLSPLTCWCIWGWKTTFAERPVLRNDPPRGSPFSHGISLAGSSESQTRKPDTFHVLLELTL